MYKYGLYDPTDDIISLIDSGEENDERTDAPNIEDTLLTRNEVLLEDRSRQELIVEQCSLGAQFLGKLKKIGEETAKRVREIDVPGLQGKIESLKWNSLMKQYEDFQMDTLETTCPKFVLAMAAALVETKRNDEDVQNLLTLEDKDGKRKPKWPNHFPAVHLLITIADRDQNSQEVVRLLTDEKGKERFPGHKGATIILVANYKKTGQFGEIAKILDKLDPQSEVWQKEDIFQSYIQALNFTKRFDEVTNKFTNNGKIIIPCRINNTIITNIANSFNLMGKYQEAYELIRPLLNDRDARRSSFFGTVAGIAMEQIGLHREIIRLLADRDGRCIHPENPYAVRSLAYAFININYIPEAEGLLYAAREQNLFSRNEFSAMENALSRKKWPDRTRR